MYAKTSATPVVSRHEPSRLLEEIQTLEHRLRAMGEDGDCAYERAMSTLYRGMVEERKQRLSELALVPVT